MLGATFHRSAGTVSRDDTLQGLRLGVRGLGLSISQQLISALGGTIRVESQPSQGATFSVELPRVR
nr:ATP-binding protein [Hyalangium minutum]